MFIRSIACCSRHLVLTENGQVLDAQKAQDGLDSQRIFEGVFAGSNFSAAVTTDSELFVWGDTLKGLFVPTAVDMYIGADSDPSRYTHPVRFTRDTFSNSPVRTVSLGDVHVLVVTEAGLLYTRGWGGHGLLGRGGQAGRGFVGSSLLMHVAIPSVSADAHVTGVAAGQSSSCIVTKDGLLFVFGAGTSGIFNDFVVRWFPVPVSGFGVGAGEVKAIQASVHWHVAVLDADGRIHTAGRNCFGELGTGDRAKGLHVLESLLLTRIESSAMCMVACGRQHTLALDLLGCVWVCGKSGLGCVCMGDTGGSGERRHGRPATCCAGMVDDAMGVVYSDSVCVLQPVEGLSDVVFITAGIHVSMVVNSEGAVFEWGNVRSREVVPEWWPGSALTTASRLSRGLPVMYTCVPTPQAVAVPARVGRYGLSLGPLFALALAMGGHKRLGEKSWLYMPSTDVLRKIAEACVVRDPANLKENE